MTSSQRVRVSICNARTPSDVTAVIAGGADAVGVHVAPTHPTHATITLDQALTLLAHVPAYMGRYATTTATNQTDLDLLVSSLPIDTLHLSPAVTTATARAMRLYHPHLRLVKSLIVSPPELPDPTPWLPIVDAILFNVGRPTADPTARALAWADIAALAETLPLPVILAGGLNPANVANAAAQVRPWAINADSGVTRHGHKQQELIAALVAQANILL